MWIEMIGTFGEIWIKAESVTGISFDNPNSDECYVACGHQTYVMSKEEGNKLVELLNGDAPTIKADELVLDTIISIERGETSNSNSPLWRCTTANGERVNIFKHEDESKDNFHLFEKKGWGDVLLALELYNRVDTYPFAIAMKRDGKWWSIVDVMQVPVAVELVPQLPFTSLPGDESLDDVLPLWSEQLTPYQVKVSQMSDEQLKKEHGDNQYYERMYGKSVHTTEDERRFFKYHDQLNATEAELEKRKAKAADDANREYPLLMDDTQEGAEHGE